MTAILEFWPEYNAGPLWTQDGKEADLPSIGVPDPLRQRLEAWNTRSDNTKLPPERDDVAWLEEGKALLGEVRSALGARYSVIVTEPWWGEEPTTP